MILFQTKTLKTVLIQLNHHEVSFPVKDFHDELGDSYLTNKGRLKNFFKRFKENKNSLLEYNEIIIYYIYINEQKNLNVIEEATDYEVEPTHYLPHRPVIREDKQTTKTRIVFDASCKSRVEGPSLNVILESGPSLTPLLTDVLLKFRSFNYVLVADIEKVFLQINLNPDHRNSVRFLWFKDIENLDFTCFENNPLIDLRFCTLLFGVTCSPFLLEATLSNHISKYEHIDLLFVAKLLKSLHKDDLTTGANTINKGFEFYEKTKHCLSKGDFNLRKFKSNCKELENLVYEKFPDDETYSNENKVVGILWDKHSYNLMFDFNDIRSKFIEKPTKRSIIQSLASIYDPLGLIAPVIVKMKFFLKIFVLINLHGMKNCI